MNVFHTKQNGIYTWTSLTLTSDLGGSAASSWGCMWRAGHSVSKVDNPVVRSSRVAVVPPAQFRPILDQHSPSPHCLQAPSEETYSDGSPLELSHDTGPSALHFSTPHSHQIIISRSHPHILPVKYAINWILVWSHSLDLGFRLLAHIVRGSLTHWNILKSL